MQVCCRAPEDNAWLLLLGKDRPGPSRASAQVPQHRSDTIRRPQAEKGDRRAPARKRAVCVVGSIREPQRAKGEGALPSATDPVLQARSAPDCRPALEGAK